MRVIGNAGTLGTVRNDEGTLRDAGTVRAIRIIGTLSTVREDVTLRDRGTVRVVGIAGTLGTVRDDLTLRKVGMVRVVGNAGTLDTVRDDQTLKFYSDVSTEESSVWVCPLNEERGFVAYIFS